MDVATIILCLRDETLWWYYGLMATVGSLVGGYAAYRVARKGGKEALERRFSRARVDTVCQAFERWGFGAIAIPAVLPPPVPMTPFLYAAGAMQYPARKFLAALALGRITRYMALSYVAARYGRRIIALIAKHAHPVAVGIIVALVAAVAAVFYFCRGRRSARQV
jgi:membrane protein YqaA with SNARE-associated domain